MRDAQTTPAAGPAANGAPAHQAQVQAQAQAQAQADGTGHGHADPAPSRAPAPAPPRHRGSFPIGDGVTLRGYADRGHDYWVAQRGPAYLGDGRFAATLDTAARFPVFDDARDGARAALALADGAAEYADREAAVVSAAGGGAVADSPAEPGARPAPAAGLRFERAFSRGLPPSPEGLPGVLDEFEWETRTAEIPGAGFRQEGVVAPAGYSQTAVNVVAQKFFYGDPARGRDPKSGGREHHVGRMVLRVTETVAGWGLGDGYFASAADARAFGDDLAWLCLAQHGSLNSPVWFNVGVGPAYGVRGGEQGYRWADALAQPVACRDSYRWPQASACFIQSVKDDMASIMALAASEAILFKHGSGTGTDLTPLRSTREKLSGGGRPSGPVSFLRIYDKVGGQIKSGGKARRAARMNTLKDTHPDLKDFITCKAREDRKAKALIDAGYSQGMTGAEDEAYGSVDFQNTNLAIRASDAFMESATSGRPGRPDWALRAVTTGEPVTHVSACDLLDEVAACDWECGDPGVQYEDTIQRWHTCPNAAPINSSNPCSEYMFIDDSACNLASLNLEKFRAADGTFDAGRFRAAVRVFLVAQEILVDRASYPTEAICRNSHAYRPLGLGYAGLGGYLMASGLPYDSDEGRALAAAVTAVMHGEALLTSAELAGVKGAFPGFAADRDAMLRVVGMHRDAAVSLRNGLEPRFVDDVPTSPVPESCRVAREAVGLLEDSLDLGRRVGYRNAQVTLLAPTGTIAFMMDADTTGCEPAIAPRSVKALSGGGRIEQTVRSAAKALGALGLPAGLHSAAERHLAEHGGFDDFPPLSERHKAVFDCAYPARPGGRCLSWEAHVDMVAAVQPFLSGAVSKTVNFPADATPADFRAAFVRAWRKGVKAVALYRDGSKGVQPVTAGTGRPPADVRRECVADKIGEANAIARDMRAASEAADAPAVTEAFMEAADVEAAAGLGTPARDYADPAGWAELRPGDGYKLVTTPGVKTGPRRERLPDTRRSLTHKFSVGGHEGYLTVGFYPDGRPGELFVKMSKEGSTIAGLMDSVAIAASIGLQHGIPLEAFCRKFAWSRFEPAGPTGDPDVPMATSVADYVFRWLAVRLLGLRGEFSPRKDPPPATGVPAPPPGAPARLQSDAPPCQVCGGMTVRVGGCYQCQVCAASGGCG